MSNVRIIVLIADANLQQPSLEGALVKKKRCNKAPSEEDKGDYVCEVAVDTHRTEIDRLI